MTLDEGFVELVTERLLIRRFRLSDAEPLASYRANPEVARFQSWCADFDRAAAKEFIRSMNSRQPGEAGAWFQFAVVTRDENRLIGDCGLCCSTLPPWLIELGFSLAPEWQGRGYAAEALRAVTAYAFTALDAAAVLGVTDRRNAAACKLMKSIGWKKPDGEIPAPPSGPLSEHEVMYMCRNQGPQTLSAPAER